MVPRPPLLPLPCLRLSFTVAFKAEVLFILFWLFHQAVKYAKTSLIVIPTRNLFYFISRTFSYLIMNIFLTINARHEKGRKSIPGAKQNVCFSPWCYFCNPGARPQRLSQGFHPTEIMMIYHALNSSHGKTYLITKRGVSMAFIPQICDFPCYKSLQKYCFSFPLYPCQFHYWQQYFAHNEPEYCYSITWIMFVKLCEPSNLPAHSAAVSSSGVCIPVWAVAMEVQAS